MSGQVVQLDERRTTLGALRADVEFLSNALAAAHGREAELRQKVQQLNEEALQLENDRDRWAHEWSAAQQLLSADGFDRDQYASKRYCCFCGREYLGNARACGSHLYLLMLDNERPEHDELVSELFEPVTLYARGAS